jgi:hypothetical protein
VKEEDMADMARQQADPALVCDQAASRLAPSGFDPSRDETKLYVADADRHLAFLELDDVSLGRFCRSYLIEVERALHKTAGDKSMPLSLAASMHGAIALYRIAVEANAGKYTLNQEGVVWAGEQQGNWRLVVERTSPSPPEQPNDR